MTVKMAAGLEKLAQLVQIQMWTQNHKWLHRPIIPFAVKNATFNTFMVESSWLPSIDLLL